MKHVLFWIAVLPLIVVSAGCDENLADVLGPTDLEPTLSSIQREIFNSGDSNGRPACIQCHNAANAAVAAGLILTNGVSYQNLVNRPSTGRAGAVRVIPNDPDGSYLIQKIEGAPGIAGDRMPQGGPYLTAAQISVIRQWIAQGAQNN
jgi:hypothetical protein